MRVVWLGGHGCAQVRLRLLCRWLVLLWVIRQQVMVAQCVDCLGDLHDLAQGLVLGVLKQCAGLEEGAQQLLDRLVGAGQVLQWAVHVDVVAIQLVAGHAELEQGTGVVALENLQALKQSLGFGLPIKGVNLVRVAAWIGAGIRVLDVLEQVRYRACALRALYARTRRRQQVCILDRERGPLQAQHELLAQQLLR